MKPLGAESSKELEWTTGKVAQLAAQKLRRQPYLTVDDLHTPEIGEPPSQTMWGAVMRHPAFRSKVEPAGFTYSHRTGGIIRIWESLIYAPAEKAA